MQVGVGGAIVAGGACRGDWGGGMREGELASLVVGGEFGVRWGGVRRGGGGRGARGGQQIFEGGDSLLLLNTFLPQVENELSSDC